MLFALSELELSYGTVSVLKNITVQVDHGAIGLLGPNGAGKTTFIKTLLGLLEPNTGSGTVLGHNILTEQTQIRERVGYMPENEAVFGNMTGFESVVYAARLSGLPRTHAMRRAHEVLDYAGLEEARYRVVEGYSTGMRQRVKLAQALVHGPELVFLDEPTNGLDPRGREDMLDIISRLNQIPVSVVLSSHLLQDVERVCDTVLVMVDGHIRHHGPLTSFTAAKQGQYEVQVKTGGARLIDALTVAGFQIESTATDRDRFQLTVQEDQLDTFWRTSQQLGVQVRTFAPVQISLEKAFVRLVENA